jgi:hypothetical protein
MSAARKSTNCTSDSAIVRDVFSCVTEKRIESRKLYFGPHAEVWKVLQRNHATICCGGRHAHKEPRTLHLRDLTSEEKFTQTRDKHTTVPSELRKHVSIDAPQIGEVCTHREQSRRHTSDLTALASHTLHHPDTSK